MKKRKKRKNNKIMGEKDEMQKKEKVNLTKIKDDDELKTCHRKVTSNKVIIISPRSKVHITTPFKKESLQRGFPYSIRVSSSKLVKVEMNRKLHLNAKDFGECADEKEKRKKEKVYAK